MQSLECGESDHSVTVGVTATNKPFNRFKNITVCEYNTCVLNKTIVEHILILDDDNRIILQPLSGCADCSRDYINASYVDVS